MSMTNREKSHRDCKAARLKTAVCNVNDVGNVKAWSGIINVVTGEYDGDGNDGLVSCEDAWRWKRPICDETQKHWPWLAIKRITLVILKINVDKLMTMTESERLSGMIK